MQPNGDLPLNGAPSSGIAQGNAAARSADPTANLPDDVFGPNDLRRVEPKASNTRTAGLPFAGHILRGGPDAGTAIPPASMTILCYRLSGVSSMSTVSLQAIFGSLYHEGTHPSPGAGKFTRECC